MALLKHLAQAARSANRRRLERRHAAGGLTYAQWIERHDTLGEPERQAIQARLAALPRRPLISVLMPVFNPDVRWLAEAIASVEQQLYTDWELCIADDCSTDPAVRPVLQAAAARDTRIRVVFRARNGHISQASNSALELARGEFMALLDHDDLLPAHALALNAEAIVHCPRARLLYSDEDVVRFDGRRQAPVFKPDWNRELMRAQNLVCHLGLYHTELLRQVGGFRSGFEGAQDYDIALRCVEHLRDEQIVHIPHVLYHWRQHAQSSAAGDEVKPYIREAGRRALQSHLDRSGVRAGVDLLPGGNFRLRHPKPDPAPRVSLLTEGDAQAAANGIDWPALEVLPLSADGTRGSRINAAAQQAQGEYLCLLAAGASGQMGWLAEMVSLAARAGTGAVGARLIRADRSLVHGGWVLGAGPDGIAAPRFVGLPAGSHGYRSRALLNQNLAALGGACLLVRREHFLAAGGFDAELTAPDLADIDFCLRVQALGLRNVWAAHATVVLHDDPTPPWPAADVARLKLRWSRELMADPAYNPNLGLQRADFSLAPMPRVNLLTPWFASGSTAA